MKALTVRATGHSNSLLDTNRSEKRTSVMPLPLLFWMNGRQWLWPWAFNLMERDGFHSSGFTGCIIVASCQLCLIPKDGSGWAVTFFFPSTVICFLYSFFLQWCIYTRPNNRWTPNSRAQSNSSKGLLWELRGCLSNHQNDRWSQYKATLVFLFLFALRIMHFAYWRVGEASSLIVSFKTPQSISYSIPKLFFSGRNILFS